MFKQFGLRRSFQFNTAYKFSVQTILALCFEKTFFYTNLLIAGIQYDPALNVQCVYTCNVKCTSIGRQVKNNIVMIYDKLSGDLNEVFPALDKSPCDLQVITKHTLVLVVTVIDYILHQPTC